MTSRRILKFPLPIYGDATIYTNDTPRFLAVNFQLGTPVIWVEAEEGALTPTNLYVAFTGDTVPPDSTYLGSAQNKSYDDYYVVHIYALGRKEFLKRMVEV